MATNPFESQDQVKRVWPILDGLARRAWERDGLTLDQIKAVSGAAGKLFSELLSATHDLAPEVPARQTPPRGIDVRRSFRASRIPPTRNRSAYIRCSGPLKAHSRRPR
jgi:hypothetical protein